MTVVHMCELSKEASELRTYLEGSQWLAIADTGCSNRKRSSSSPWNPDRVGSHLQEPEIRNDRERYIRPHYLFTGLVEEESRLPRKSCCFGDGSCFRML